MNKYQKVAMKVAKIAHPVWMQIPEYEQECKGNVVRMRNAVYNTFKENNDSIIDAYSMLQMFQTRSSEEILVVGKAMIEEIILEDTLNGK